MSETKGLVKCALGFILAILVMVGGAFGLDVRVNVDDTNEPTSDVAETVTEEQPVDETETQSPVETTPTEDQEQSVDESVEADVTEPTDDTQETVTENIEKGEN